MADRTGLGRIGYLFSAVTAIVMMIGGIVVANHNSANAEHVAQDLSARTISATVR